MRILPFALVALCAAFSPSAAETKPARILIAPFCQLTDWNQDGELNRYVDVKSSISEPGTDIGSGRLCGCDPLAWGQIAVYHALKHGFPEKDWIPPNISNPSAPPSAVNEGAADITDTVGGAHVQLGAGGRTWIEPRSTMPGAYDWEAVAQKKTLTDADGKVIDSPVGRLMWNLGIIGHTLYVPGSSSGTIYNYRFQAYFGNEGCGYQYSLYLKRPTTSEGATVDPEGWEKLYAMLRCTLAAEAPASTTVSLDAGPHQVVVDGYGIDVYGNEVFHIDYGWGNNPDGDWETLEELGNKYRAINVNVHPKELGAIVTGRVAYADLSGVKGVTATLTDGIRTYAAATDDAGIYVITGLPENSFWDLSLSDSDGTVLKAARVALGDFYDDFDKESEDDGKDKDGTAAKDKGEFTPHRYAGAVVDLTLDAYPETSYGTVRWIAPNGKGDGKAYDSPAAPSSLSSIPDGTRVCLLAGDYTVNAGITVGKNCLIEGGYIGPDTRDPWHHPTLIRFTGTHQADLTAGNGSRIDGIRFLSGSAADYLIRSAADTTLLPVFDRCLFVDTVADSKKTLYDARLRRCAVATPLQLFGSSSVLHCAFAGILSEHLSANCVDLGGNVDSVGGDLTAWRPSDTLCDGTQHTCPTLGIDGAPLKNRLGPFASSLRSLSINFVGGRDGKANEAYAVPDDPWINCGLAPVPASLWRDIDAVPSGGKTLTVTPQDSAGNTVTLAFSANTVWEATQMSDPFMKGFLDDTGGHPVSVEIKDIPYGTYDLLLYTSTDQSAGFLPFSVNGTYYTAGTGEAPAVKTEEPKLPYGDAKESATRLNVNVLRITGLTGATLSVKGQERDASSNCGTLSALQIIERLPGYSLRLR